MDPVLAPAELRAVGLKPTVLPAYPVLQPARLSAVAVGVATLRWTLQPSRLNAVALTPPAVLAAP